MNFAFDSRFISNKNVDIKFSARDAFLELHSSTLKFIFFSKSYHLKKTKAKGRKQNSKTQLYLIEINIIYTLELQLHMSSSFGIQLSIHRMITSCCACVG
jgi:hypothetical protein